MPEEKNNQSTFQDKFKTAQEGANTLNRTFDLNYGYGFEPGDIKKEDINPVDTRTRGEKAAWTKVFKKQLRESPAGQTIFAPTRSEKSKQTKAIAPTKTGTAVTGVRNENEFATAAGETLPKSGVEMGNEKNVEYAKYRQQRLAEIEKEVVGSGSPWDKKSKSMAEKTILDEFNKQQAARETENIEKGRAVEGAIAKGQETMTLPEGETEPSEETERYNRAKELLNDPNIDKDSAAYFNASKIVNNYEHEEKINQLMSENDGMDRNTAESYLAEQNRKQKEAEEIKQMNEVRAQTRYDLQNIIDNQPDGMTKNWARDQIALMDQEDKVKDFLIKIGFSENSPSFNRAFRKNMNFYNKITALEKADDKERARKELKAIKDKQDNFKRNLGMALSFASIWVKAMACLLAYGTFVGF